MRVHDFSAENPPLHPGDELHCPHCRRWHGVAAMNSTGTEYTRLMLFWECRGGRYYAGQIGTAPVFSTQKMPSSTARLLIQGRPPRLDHGSRGRSGSILAHCASVNRTLRLATRATSGQCSTALGSKVQAQNAIHHRL
jgi:hypothetical protein